MSGLVWKCIFVLLIACTPAEKTAPTPGVTADTIVIGSSAALSGHASFLGSQYTLGSKLWFSEINAAGGIHGRKIQFLTYDDGYEPEMTRANTEKLIADDQVFMLFDYVGTPTSVKIIEAVHEDRIPALGFFTGAEALRTPFRPYMFHVRASYYSEAEGAIAYFVDHLGFSKIAVMYQDDAFGLAVLAGVQLAMRKRGLEIVATDTFIRGTTELQHAVSTISKSGAEAVIMVGTYTPLARFIRLNHEQDFFPYFHTVSFVGSAAFAQAILEERIDPMRYEQIIVTQVVPSPNSDGSATIAAYRDQLEKFSPESRPNYVSLEGYINARVLTDALQRGGPKLTREKLIQTLENMSDIELGIDKRLTYGELDHNGLEGIYYSRLLSDGSFGTFDLPQ